MQGIYKITNPQGKIYIGCTIDWERRVKEYRKMIFKGQSLIFESLIDYGFKNHQFEFIEECKPEDLYEREIYWVKHYNSVEGGLNIRNGGRNGTLSDGTKDKISKSLKGRKVTWVVNRELISKKVKEYHRLNPNSLKGKKRKKIEGTSRSWYRELLVSPNLINEIRTKYKTKLFTISQLSREYGISWGTADNIIKNKKSYI